MILLIDNYDSFSYNLVQIIGKIIIENDINEEIKVIRNDEMTVKGIEKLMPDYIVISPGPGKPKDAGICEEVVTTLGSKTPILGICLGHQGICEAFGANVTYAKELMHGKESLVIVDTSSPIFEGVSERTLVARYHSLAVEKESIPEVLQVIAEVNGEVMAVKHREYNIYGLQFHPESILTNEGEIMLKNFLSI